VPDREVWAFGSRAKWTAKEYSDLDIAIIGNEPLSLNVMAELMDAFQESDLPFKVDVVDWATTKPPFRRAIESSKIAVISKLGDSRVGSNIRQEALGEIATIRQGRYLPPEAMTPSPAFDTAIPVWGARGILGYAREATFDKAVPLVTCRGNGCGLVQWTGTAAYISNNAMSIMPKTNLESDVRYMYYALLNESFLDVTTGSAQPQITISHLSKKSIFWHDSAAARASIASVLGALDDKIELNRKMSETLEAMARALFKSWFVDFDPVRAKAEGRDSGLPPEIADLFPASFIQTEFGEIPTGWRVGSVLDVASLNPESWSNATRPNTIRYVDLSNVKWGKFEAPRVCGRANSPSRAQRVLYPGDTIVGTVRPNNGSYGLVSESGLTGSTGFAVLRPKRSAALTYLAVTSKDNLERLGHLADGGAYPAIRPEVVGATTVSLAPENVIRIFDDIASLFLNRYAKAEHESRTLSFLRDALLPKLISGEIRVPDAERIVEKAP